MNDRTKKRWAKMVRRCLRRQGVPEPTAATHVRQKQRPLSRADTQSLLFKFNR